MTLTDHIKTLSEMEENDRDTYLTHLEIKNYGSSELTETEMWILSQAASNNEYLTNKLKEADELSLDTEAPVEPTVEPTVEPEVDLGMDTPTDTTDISTSNDDLSIDTPTEDPTVEPEVDLETDTPTDSENTPSDSNTTEEPKKEIETSKAGIGILPLLGEIQEKLANGKPSEVELAALKAIKKLVG